MRRSEPRMGNVVADSNPVRKAGVMSIVIAEGDVRPGDALGVEIPAESHRRLQPV